MAGSASSCYIHSFIQSPTSKDLEPVLKVITKFHYSSQYNEKAPVNKKRLWGQRE